MEEILNKKDPQNEDEIDLYKKVAVLGKSFFIVVKKRKNRDEIFVSGEVGKIIGWTEQQVIDQKGKYRGSIKNYIPIGAAYRGYN